MRFRSVVLRENGPRSDCCADSPNFGKYEVVPDAASEALPRLPSFCPEHEILLSTYLKLKIISYVPRRLPCEKLSYSRLQTG